MKIPLERKCHEKNLDRTHHDYHGYRDHHRSRPGRGGSRSFDLLRARSRDTPHSTYWSAGRCLLWARILDERDRERRERARAVKPAEKTARLEGYKASVAPFCGLFSLHKKIAQNGRLSPEAASGTAGRT